MTLNKSELNLKYLLTFWTILFTAVFIWALLDIGSPAPPFQNNFVLIYSLISLPVLIFLSLLGSKGVRANALFTQILKFILCISVLIYLVIIIVRAIKGLPVESYIYPGLFYLLTYIITKVFFDKSIKARFDLRYLSPEQALTFRALADVIVDGGKLEKLTASDLTTNIDHYLSSFYSPRKFQIKFSFIALEYFPLAFLNLPTSWMGVEERIDFIKKHFYKSTGTLRDLIRGAFQLSYLSYYGDERTFDVTGFIPFEERERYKKMPKKPDPPELKVIVPDGSTREINTDILVIGSGAGGAVVAAELAKKTNQKVTILEKGNYYVPQKDFDNREPTMISKLYVDGGLQLTQDFDLSILQGSCLGGTTVINNGICFRIPEPVLDEWDNLGTKLDRNLLSQKYSDVEKNIRVKEITPDIANKGASKIFEGTGKLNLNAEWFKTNFEECGGSGYCNLGCKYNRKLSMLLNYLPKALESGAEIVTSSEALKIETSGSKVKGVLCKTKSGHKFRVNAKHVIVSCGTIASSTLLMKSGIKNNVGTRVSFNVASPMHAEFPDKLNSFDGVQMCCYIHNEGLLIENTFNPPAASSLIMPGWFEQHFNRMQRYQYLATAAPVVGSHANGSIKKQMIGGYQVDYTITNDDFNQLKDGMKLTSKIFFAAGANKVYPATFDSEEITSESDIDRIIEQIKKPEDVSMTSAHPQGGNPMSDDPSIGVVDTGFKVHGTDNLYVCDASVFPTSVKVNPQLTIMAMAEYASDKIKENL